MTSGGHPGSEQRPWIGRDWREPARLRETAAVLTCGLIVGLAVILALDIGLPALSALYCLLALLVALTLGLRRALLAAALLSLPFQMGIVLGYREDAGRVGSLGGVEISATTLAVIGLWVLWLVARWLHHDAPRIDVGAFRPFAWFVAVVAVAAVFSRSRWLGLAEVALLLEMLALGTYVAVWARRRAERDFMVGCLLVGSGLQAAFIIAGRAVGAVPGDRIDATLGGSTLRSGGTIGSPNTAGSYLAAMLVVAVTLAFGLRRHPSARLARFCIPFLAIALVLTFSRGAWVGTAVGVAVVVLGGVVRGWIDTGRLVVAGLIAILLASVLLVPVMDRATRDDAGAFAGRGLLAEMAGEVISEHPFTGVGPNTLGLIFQDRFSARNHRTWIYTVHNKYLLVWAETGILGLVAFAYFLVSSLRSAYRATRTLDLDVGVLGLACGAALVGLMVHMLVEPFNSRSQINLLVLLAALALASEHAARSGREAVGVPVRELTRA